MVEEYNLEGMDRSTHGFPMTHLVTKLNRVRGELIPWNKVEFGHLDERISNLPIILREFKKLVKSSMTDVL